jgi:hypothetical protein
MKTIMQKWRHEYEHSGTDSFTAQGMDMLQVSAFQLFSFLLHPQVSESSSATTSNMRPGFAAPHFTPRKSSNMRWVCCCREVISTRR